jgi:hypothetical protein
VRVDWGGEQGKGGGMGAQQSYAQQAALRCLRRAAHLAAASG